MSGRTVLKLQRACYVDKVQQEVEIHVRGSQGMSCRAPSWHHILPGICCGDKRLQGRPPLCQAGHCKQQMVCAGSRCTRLQLQCALVQEESRGDKLALPGPQSYCTTIICTDHKAGPNCARSQGCSWCSVLQEVQRCRNVKQAYRALATLHKAHTDKEGRAQPSTVIGSATLPAPAAPTAAGVLPKTCQGTHPQRGNG